MKRIILPSLVFLFLAASALRAQSTEKVLIKSFNLQGHEVVLLEMPGEVEVQTWNNSWLQIQVKVKLADAGPAVLKSLVLAGRYDVQARSTEEGLELRSKNLQRVVELNGKPLQESFSILVKAPRSTQVRLRTSDQPLFSSALTP